MYVKQATLVHHVNTKRQIIFNQALKMMMIHPDQSLMLVEGMSNKLIIDKHTPYGYKLASALVVAINI